MEHAENKQLHISEVFTVKCKLCATTIRRKNYKVHLKTIYPKANSEDLSGWTQPKISSMFKDDHPSQAVEPAPVLVQSDNDTVVVENRYNEGLPGQVDKESSQPADCVKSTVLPTSAEGDSGNAELCFISSARL